RRTAGRTAGPPAAAGSYRPSAALPSAEPRPGPWPRRPGPSAPRPSPCPRRARARSNRAPRSEPRPPSTIPNGVSPVGLPGRGAVVVDERGRGEAGADRLVAAALVSVHAQVVDVDDARVLADPIEEDPEIVIASDHIHLDRELLVEVHRMQPARGERLQP